MGQIQYEKFGLEYTVGKRVIHLNSGSKIRTQCGILRLGLKVSPKDGVALCGRCKKTIKVVRAKGARIGIYKSFGRVVACPEKVTHGNGERAEVPADDGER